MDRMAEDNRDGSGKAASAAVEAWLAAHAAPPPVDAGALLDLRLALARVCEADIVKRDAEASRILGDMALAVDMDDFHAGLDRLGRRVAALTSGKGTPPAARPARAARHLIRI